MNQDTAIISLAGDQQRRHLLLWLAAALAAMAMTLVLGVQPAAAQDVGLCVQDQALLDNDPNNNNLQCTANDVTIAKYNTLNGVTSFSMA